MLTALTWTPVFNAVANEFVKGLGRRLGETTGAALTEAIFGAQDDPDQKWRIEVDLRLSRIEQKLDGLIGFIGRQLPALVYEQNRKSSIGTSGKRYQKRPGC